MPDRSWRKTSWKVTTLKPLQKLKSTVAAVYDRRVSGIRPTIGDDRSPLQFCPARQGLIQRKFVGRFEAATGGKTAGNPRQHNRFVLQQFHNVIGGRFAFDISRQSENHLGEIFGVDPL